MMIGNDTLAALTLIADERDRQIKVKGWTPQHDDDEHTDGGLALAAASYALHAVGKFATSRTVWPWDLKGFKPKDTRRDLVRAGALIVAALERVARIDAAARGQQWGPQVLSGCAVRASMQLNKANIPTGTMPLTAADVLRGPPTGPSVATLANEALELQRRQFMAAIDFAIQIDEGGDERLPGEFLKDWREGDVSAWPKFKGPVPW
jgi:hypothetical protein